MGEYNDDSDFDPYYKWLGIPPSEQPPNHYRLLGIALFESDPDVISNAADRQMIHVRTFQSGKRAELSQKVLNALAAARVCLLDPKKKAEYDATLRTTLEAPSSPPSSAPAAAGTAAAPSVPVAYATPLEDAPVRDIVQGIAVPWSPADLSWTQPALDADSRLNVPGSATDLATGSPMWLAAPAVPVRPVLRRAPRKHWLLVGGTVAATAGVFILLVVMLLQAVSREREPPDQGAENPQNVIRPAPVVLGRPVDAAGGTTSPPADNSQGAAGDPPSGSSVPSGTQPQQQGATNDPSANLAKSLTSSIGLQLVLIPAGEFLMGSPLSESNRGDDEGSNGPRRVRITRPFYLGIYEVTQAQYQKVMGYNPSQFSATNGQRHRVTGINTDDFPVEWVNFYDAVEFCNRLSEQDGLPPYYVLRNVVRRNPTIVSAEVAIAGGNGYRLPTEAEWEYACRAGTSTPFHFGTVSNGSFANINGRQPYGSIEVGPYLQRPTNVGSYPANAFGLHDMHGNVREWCEDYYDKHYYDRAPEEDPVNHNTLSHRAVRGGSWLAQAWGSRSAKRVPAAPGLHYFDVGLRVARNP
jgi:formylglycine-generating enzyme required for sulfatase activity